MSCIVSLRRTCKLSHLLIALALMMSTGYGQTSVVDGKTPTGLTPGSPAGSYPLSGFENINLYNGNLSFHLPLLQVGGRGNAGYTMTLPIEQKWIAKRGETPPSGAPLLTPNPNWWEGIKPGYGPGVMQGRRTSHETNRTYDDQSGILVQINLATLTRLTFTAADGTEYEFRDQLTGGEPDYVTWYPSQGDGLGFSRGTVFVTGDGSSATFISDTAISDYRSPNINLNNRLVYPSGLLMLKDGTRYRIDGGEVSWVSDRNGNKVTFGATIKDSLNREVTVTLADSDTPYDEISYSAFGGVNRKIKVWYDTLANRLRPGSGYSLQTYYQLFPLNAASTSSTFNPSRVSRVELPDGRSYEFYYNPYGELARVVLPTGGAFEYDWAGITDVSEGNIFRFVTERRVYLVAGGAAEHKTQYIRNGSGASMEVKVFNGNGTVLLGRSLHYFYGNAESSMEEDPSRPSAINFSPWQEGREYRTETFDIVNATPVLKNTIEHTWQQPLAGNRWPLTTAESSASVKANDPQITQTVMTLADTNQVTKQTFSFDLYSNRTDVYEYDYGAAQAGPLVRHTHTDFLTTNPVNGYDYACNPATTCGNTAAISDVIHLRSLLAQSQVFDASGVEQSRTTYEYDNYTATVNHAVLEPRSNISGHDPLFTVSYAKRGNATASSSYLLTNGSVTGTASAYAQYDIAGNVVKTIDARGYATMFSFSDCFGVPDGNARLNSAPSELAWASQSSYAFPTLATNALGHTAYAQFDYYTGKSVDDEDANGIVASSYYNDALDRPTQVRKAVGTAIASQITLSYDDVNRVITSTSDLNTFGDNALKGQTLYDGLGRTTETRQYETASTYITVRTNYDALGRTHQTSNPFRADETVVWTTSGFDALGRVTSVSTPDNAVVSTNYLGNQITVTDQAGRARRSIADALGRLKEVYEDPAGSNYLTSYSYDALDNLTNVSQGVQTRSFAYDSLRRLRSATNPESGTITYTYDDSGNLTQKSDARGITSVYAYDALNRNITVDYSNTTINPDITRNYDGATNGKGRLWESYAGGTETTGTTVEHVKVHGYEALGRPLDQRQRFKSNSVWSSEYQTLRAYNLSGNVTSQTYPSGRTVSYGYDSAGRTSSFTGNLGGESRTYATGITYSPFGGKTREQFGTNTAVYHKLHYNVRGQLYDVRASNVNDDLGGELGALVNHYSNVWVHGGSGPDNNGNVLMSQTIVNGNFMEDRYSYDALNRLTSVAEYQNGATLTGRQTYTYDRYGNRTIDAAQTSGVGINNKQFTVSTSNNRLGIPGGQTGTMSYDNAGNLTADTYSGSAVTRVYDAENRMTSETQGGSLEAGAYTYNADGQRVRRKVNGVETWQVYGMDGELLAEYAANAAANSPQKEYGYRNGELLVTADAPPPPSINGYTYQRTLTIDHHKIPNTVQTNFPLLISGTYAYLATVANGGNLQNVSGFDVIFTTDAGCATKLNHEVETYNAATGAVNYWVKVPTLSHTADTSIYMCYGNASITTDQSNKPGVWDANYKGVWHLPNGSSLSTTDSTANGNNGTNNSASAVSGKVDGAANFNGTSQNISVPQIVATNTTVEHWVYRTGPAFVVMVDTGWNATDGFVTVVAGGKHTFIKQARFSVFSPTISALNTWEHVVWTVDTDNKARLYVNGSLTYTDTDTQAIISQTHGGSIGSRLDVSGNPIQYFPGTLDEVRISNIARSADWIAASYNNQSSPATFYSISSATSGSSSAEIKWLVSDHLGTPRMVVDQTGTLAGVKRHDYLPFGEELLAGTGGRTLAQGYSGDAVRQKFTSKERDIETGLDYFLARYYSSTQGRFTSPDEFTGGPDELYTFAEDASDNPTFYADLTNPQSLNKYQYTYNNPVNMVDRDGHCPEGAVGVLCRVAPVVISIPYVREAAAAAAAVVILATVFDAIPGDRTAGGGDCPSCQRALEAGQRRMEQNEKKAPPNPDGQKGAPDHQNEVNKQADKARAEAKPGETVQENKQIKGVDSTRRPDVQLVGRDGKVVKVVEVERRPNSRRNRDREKEYERLKVPNQTVPLPRRRN